MKQEEKDCLREARVTLDDLPAVLSGFRMPYAIVTILPDGPEVSFSWEAVRRVVAKGGDFKS